MQISIFVQKHIDIKFVPRPIFLFQEKIDKFTF